MPNESLYMTRPFRLAIVGAGMISRDSHLPAALASGNTVVAALIDPVSQRAVDLAKGYGIQPRIETSIETVLHEIDGAIIATPNATHHPIAVTCLEAGVSVLIEKPLANSVDEGREILAAASRTRSVVAVGYSTRFRNNVVLLKELLDRDYFGRVTRFVNQFGTPGGWSPLSAYNLNQTSAGGGVLVVTGTHFLDRMLYFFGAPDQVSLDDDSDGGPEANCTARFFYDSTSGKISGMARYSKTFSLPSGTVIETELGKVVLLDSDDAEIEFYPNDDLENVQIVRRRPTQYHEMGYSSTFQLQLEDFIEACQNGKPPRVDGEQGLASLQLLSQLYSNRRLQPPNRSIPCKSRQY